jgi:hypothetical protein
MSTHKHFDKICYAVLAVTLIITVLFMNGKSLGIVSTQSESSSSDMFTSNDLESDWDTTDAENIILSDDKTTISDSNCYVYDSDVYITTSGYYVVSGELSNGSIIINADSNDKIWLMLNGVSINCDNDAAIRVEQADKVFLTLADETENNISSGAQYSSDVVSSGVDGVIYSKDDLTINGNGTLNVTAQYKHGIVGNDDLIITGGNITIDAVQDAIHANDSVRIANAQINISAGDDGITVSNDDESAFLYIESGKINIDSCYEGLEAIEITIVGGDIDIAPTDDGINANGDGKNSVINIQGGDISVINTDGKDADGLDSNKDIYISGGNLFISVSNDGSSSAIDYGSENNGVCEINGGTVLACGSSGMVESISSSSSQGFIMYTTSASANTEVTVKDSDGNELISNEVPCSFSSLVVSTPEMNVGDAYTIVIGNIEEEITIDNSYSTSVFGQGGIQDGAGNNGFSPQNDSKNEYNQNGNQGKESSDFGGENAQPQMPDGTDNGGEQPQMPDNNLNGEGQGTQSFTEQQNDSPPEKPSSDDNNAPDDSIQMNDNDNNQSDDKNIDDGDQQDSDNKSNQFNADNAKFGDSGAKTQSETTGYTLTKTDKIYICVSIGVLILGCVIAFVAKRRKSI